jgi:hypothetical protein
VLFRSNCPPEKIGDFDYLMEIIDWDANVDPQFTKNRFMRPLSDGNKDAMLKAGYLREWICYRCEVAGAKRLTVLPGQSAEIKEPVAYGALCIQGWGKIGNMDISSPTLIRYGELTDDEFFVTAGAAKAGVKFVNLSRTEPLVVLYHFSHHPDRKAVESK